MTKSELRRRIADIFGFILVHCPNFPPACKTSLVKEFDELTSLLNSARENCKGINENLMRIAVDEVRLSRAAYEREDQHNGAMLLQHAEDHFKQAFRGKVVAARFTAGTSGPAADTQSGFPQ